MSSPPLSVAIVSGGSSEERAISLESGEAVARGLEAEGFRVRRVVIDDDIASAFDELRKSDVAFLALHGRYGEDGTVQEALDEAGIAYTGSGPAASRAAMDKAQSKRLFQAALVKTPKYILAHSNSDEDIGKAVEAALAEGALSMPLVVKPVASGSSLGVSIVRERAELGPAVECAREFGRAVIVEEFVAGKELAVGVLADLGRGEALPVVELAPAREFYDYAAKYEDAATGYTCPAALTESERMRVQDAGLAAFEARGCRDFGRTDVIMAHDGTPQVLEVNTIPGFTSYSLLPMAAEAAGMSFGELAGRIVRLAAARMD